MECAHFQPQLHRHESGQQQGEHQLLHKGGQTWLCMLGSASHEQGAWVKRWENR